MGIYESIRARQSIRSFKNKKADWRRIIKAIDSARFAPMAGNFFSLRIILVDDSNKIKKLASASEQDFISQVSFVVVFCTSPNLTIRSFGEEGKSFLKQQAGAAIENFLLSLEEEELSSSWIGHFDERAVKQTLGIPEEIEVEAMFPIGYKEDKKVSKKRKSSLENYLYFNTYKNKRIKKIKKVNV